MKLISFFHRREFLKGSFSMVGLAAFGGGRLFAAPAGWRADKKPNLVFGVLSDTHFRTDSGWRKGLKSDKYYAAALKYFRSRNVDAVVHCGDMADRGLVEELQLHADVWNRVFPKGLAADGHRVEKLFVAGNHEITGWGRNHSFSRFVPNKAEWPEKILSSDIARHWERIWGEKYEPVWHKNVKGYHFFGMHWGAGEDALKALIDRQNTASALAAESKPFFFITHDLTHAKFRSGIRSYRNAFGFWGHCHFSATNWGIRRMLNDVVPSVQCPACPSWWRPDGKWMGGGDRGITKVPIEGKLQGGQWHQGFVVKVYDDALVIERHEFSKGGSLGADWVMPFERGSGKREKVRGKREVGRVHPFSREKLKKVIGEPQFREGAKLEVENVANVEILPNANIQSQLETGNIGIGNTGNIGNIVIKIPLADGNPDSRVYAYEVVVIGDEGTRKLRKAVYAAGCNLGIGHEPNGGVTTLEIPASELPPGKSLTFAVRPITSLGTSGKAIATEFKV